jgi:RNA polymerase sigma-70 factor (ECF subfamily)
VTLSDGQEDDLRRRLREQPEQVLAQEFGRYRGRLWRIVSFRLDPIVARRIDTDDVLQEAWMDALQRVPNFIENETLSMFVWLRLIVCQTIVDLHRHHLGAQMRDAYREASIDSLDLTRSTTHSIAARLLATATSPSAAAMRSEVAEQLRQAIDRMDPIDREVLALRHFEELANHEVAEVLNIEQKAASIRYVRAVKRLAKILEDLPGFSAENGYGYL